MKGVYDHSDNSCVQFEKLGLREELLLMMFRKEIGQAHIEKTSPERTMQFFEVAGLPRLFIDSTPMIDSNRGSYGCT